MILTVNYGVLNEEYLHRAIFSGTYQGQGIVPWLEKLEVLYQRSTFVISLNLTPKRIEIFVHFNQSQETRNFYQRRLSFSVSLSCLLTSIVLPTQM